MFDANIYHYECLKLCKNGSDFGFADSNAKIRDFFTKGPRGFLEALGGLWEAIDRDTWGPRFALCEGLIFHNKKMHVWIMKKLVLFRQPNENWVMHSEASSQGRPVPHYIVV